MDSRDADSAALRRELRSRLGLLGAPLQLLAEDVLGEEDARIDWVAMEPDGRRPRSISRPTSPRPTSPRPTSSLRVTSPRPHHPRLAFL